jgi:hypothetical protein
MLNLGPPKALNKQGTLVEPNPVITLSVIRHLVYSIRYSVVPINFSLETTLIYNDTKQSVPVVKL